jgi:hypothetical protein
MELSQGNFPHSYLTQIKMSFFKKGGQEGKTGLVWGLALVGGGGCREKV